MAEPAFVQLLCFPFHFSSSKWKFHENKWLMEKGQGFSPFLADGEHHVSLLSACLNKYANRSTPAVICKLILGRGT